MADIPPSTILLCNILLVLFSVGITVMIGKEIYDLIQTHYGLKRELKEAKEKLRKWEEKEP